MWKFLHVGKQFYRSEALWSNFDPFECSMHKAYSAYLSFLKINELFHLLVLYCFYNRKTRANYLFQYWKFNCLFSVRHLCLHRLIFRLCRVMPDLVRLNGKKRIRHSGSKLASPDSLIAVREVLSASISCKNVETLQQPSEIKIRFAKASLADHTNPLSLTV